MGVSIAKGVTAVGVAGSLGFTPVEPITTTQTLYVRSTAAAVSFTNASANVTWASHGLSVGDAVVISIPPNRGSCTMTIASPGVITRVAHGYLAGQPVVFHSTGALPTGLTAGTTYYVISTGLAADTFRVSATVGGAAVNTSGTQSGTHYVERGGAMPTFSTEGLLAQGTIYYVDSVVDSSTITLKNGSGTALGTCTVATGSPTYYAATGSDSNTGSAADRSHALLTLQHAVDLAPTLYGSGSGIVKIQLADSRYAGATINGAPTGLRYWICGDGSDQSSVEIDDTEVGWTCIDVEATAFFTVVSDLTLLVTSTGGSGWSVDADFCLTYFANVTWKNISGSSDGDAVGVYNGMADIQIGINPLNIAANGQCFVQGNWGHFVAAGTNPQNILFIGSNGATINLLDAPAWGTAFVQTDGIGCEVEIGGSSPFVGTSTGKRFVANRGTILGVGQSLTALPGNATGTITQGASACGFVGGTATNDSAPVGAIGEIVSSYIASASGVSLTNNTAANVTSISLTAGDWDVEGNVNFAGTTATVTGGQGGINTTSATLPTDGSEVYDGTVTTTLTDTSGVTLPRKRISINATTTVYLVGFKLFSAGTVKAFGGITARRVR
jgi:hypothetical protein